MTDPRKDSLKPAVVWPRRPSEIFAMVVLAIVLLIVLGRLAAIL
jgi:hypothetical protein